MSNQLLSVDSWSLTKLTLDCANQYVPDMLANAGDANGRGIDLYLTENGLPIDATGMSVYLWWKHSNGNQDMSKFKAVSSPSGHFKCYYPPAMMYGGDVIARIAVVVGTDTPITGSRNFRIHVEENPIDENEAMAVEGFNEFVEAITAFGSFSEEAIAAEAERVAAEVIRQENEDTRVLNEASRVTAEAARETNEAGRVTAEDARALAEAQRVAQFAQMEQKVAGWLYYYCTEDEIDSNRKPVIEEPNSATIYCVPEENPTANNQWVEWRWDAEHETWEVVGTSSASISPITTDQVDSIIAGESVTSSNVMNGTILTYWFAKLKTVFANIIHRHNTTDLDGTISTEQIADNAVTSAKLDQSVRDSLSQMAARQGNAWNNSFEFTVRNDSEYLALIAHIIVSISITGNPSRLIIFLSDGSNAFGEGGGVDAGQSKAATIGGKTINFAFSSDRKKVTVSSSSSFGAYMIG